MIENLFKKLVKILLILKFFDKDLYKSKSVLTSKSIQKKFIFITKKRRNGCEINPDFCLINIENQSKRHSKAVFEQDDNVEAEMSICASESKEKHSKEKQSIAKQNISIASQCHNIKYEEEEEEACAKREIFLDSDLMSRSVPELLNEWKEELFKDRTWTETLKKYSKLAAADFEKEVRNAMKIFDEYVALTLQAESLTDKDNYGRRFFGWWRKNKFSINSETLIVGAKNAVEGSHRPMTKAEKREEGYRRADNGEYMEAVMRMLEKEEEEKKTANLKWTGS